MSVNYNLKDIAKYTTIILIFLSFIFFSASYIKAPGLYYDECIFVNAALGGIDEGFISKRINNVPVMIMPYIGALKSYIYYPVFKIFGVSAESIRLPVIIISAFTLGLSYLLARILFNQWLAIMYVAVLGTDPAFIYFSKLDFGPIVLMVLLKTAGLYLFFKFLVTSSLRYLWLLIIILTLGLYDKINFIWFIIAFVISSGLFYYVELREIYKYNRSGFLYAISSFSLLLIVAFIFVIKPLITFDNHMPNISLTQKFEVILELYKKTMTGENIYGFIIGSSMHNPSWVNYIFAITPVGLIVLLAHQFNKMNHPAASSGVPNRVVDSINAASCGEYDPEKFKHKIPWFFLTIFTLIYLQILLTKQAGGGHHIMMLYPFHLIILFAVISTILLKITNKYKSLLMFSFTAVVCLLLYSQVKANSEYLTAFKTGTSFSKLWDPHIYELSEYVRSQKFDTVLTADWGIREQLATLSPADSHSNYLEIWEAFRGPAQDNISKENVFKTYFREKKGIVIAHASGAETMKNTRDNFLKFSGLFLKNNTLSKTFYNIKGEGLYEVYSFDERTIKY
jgi:4-amino-4-deoxy-L-arabinose transferase-like glycosyltransferase